MLDAQRAHLSDCNEVISRLMNSVKITVDPGNNALQNRYIGVCYPIGNALEFVGYP